MKKNIKEKRVILLSLFAALIAIGSFFIYIGIGNRAESLVANELGIEEFEYTPTDTSYDGMVLATSAESHSSTDEDISKNKIILSDINESIEVVFAQSSQKDMDIALHVYIDYIPVKFRVQETKDFSDIHIFSLSDAKGKTFEIYLDPTLSLAEEQHKLLIDFTVGYNSYAKDVAESSSNYSATQLYDLEISSQTEKNGFIKSLYPTEKSLRYEPYQTGSVILNTDKEMKVGSNGEVNTPDKFYKVTPNSEFEFNYFISNMDPYADNALLFISVGHQKTLINQQEYLWIDLREGDMAVSRASFITPTEPGLYDVIGYIVYNPFEFGGLVYCFPQTSIRFTIEVQ